MERKLLSSPQPVTRFDDDSLVRESLSQAGQTLVNAGNDWKSRLQQAADLSRGIGGLLPWNRRKVKELLMGVKRDLEHPGIVEAAQIFDDERAILSLWFD